MARPPVAVCHQPRTATALLPIQGPAPARPFWSATRMTWTYRRAARGATWTRHGVVRRGEGGRLRRHSASRRNDAHAREPPGPNQHERGAHSSPTLRRPGAGAHARRPVLWRLGPAVRLTTRRAAIAALPWRRVPSGTQRLPSRRAAPAHGLQAPRHAQIERGAYGEPPPNAAAEGRAMVCGVAVRMSCCTWVC
jgi:hypothetical protein